MIYSAGFRRPTSSWLRDPMRGASVDDRRSVPSPVDGPAVTPVDDGAAPPTPAAPSPALPPLVALAGGVLVHRDHVRAITARGPHTTRVYMRGPGRPHHVVAEPMTAVLARLAAS